MAKRSVTDEAYFTSPVLARTSIALVHEHFPLDTFELIVEPSAGDGAFLDALPVDRRVGIDINPRRSDLVERDFLRWFPDDPTQRILVIGNPPFGQRAALAIRFMAHAATFADVIAFILPRSFNKDTFQNRVPSDFHLVASRDCDDVFAIEGRDHHVRTVFQIWERRDEQRIPSTRNSEHPHFRMRHAHLSRVSADELARLRAEYEFTIPQVGAQFRPREVSVVDKGSHWFIQPLVPGVRDVFETLDFSFLANMNTAHTSLSKADIVQAYETAVQQRPM